MHNAFFAHVFHGQDDFGAQDFGNSLSHSSALRRHVSDTFSSALRPSRTNPLNEAEEISVGDLFQQEI